MATMDKITPFLWFDDEAEEAAKFYVSVFKRGSRIEKVTRYGDAGPGPKGSVMTVAFRLQGQSFTALNGGLHFTFNPAISFVVTCKTQKEIDSLWEKLGQGGKPGQCGWLEDRFGVSWQIVPEGIGELVQDQRAMQVMLGMKKLDIKRLKQAVGAKVRAA